LSLDRRLTIDKDCCSNCLSTTKFFPTTYHEQQYSVNFHWIDGSAFTGLMHYITGWVFSFYVSFLPISYKNSLKSINFYYIQPQYYSAHLDRNYWRVYAKYTYFLLQVKYFIKLGLPMIIFDVLSLLTSTDSLCSLQDCGESNRHHTSVSCRGEVRIKRLVSQRTLDVTVAFFNYKNPEIKSAMHHTDSVFAADWRRKTTRTEKTGGLSVARDAWKTRRR